MKKLLVLALVLSMATMANAALTLGTSATELQPTESAVISVTGDGLTPTGYFFLGIAGDGLLNADNATILYTGSATEIALMEEDLGIGLPYVYFQLSDVPPVGQNPKPLDGLLVDGITMTCTGPSDVTLTLFDQNLVELGSITIAQPEPITIGLLGLGAMFLRRRK